MRLIVVRERQDNGGGSRMRLLRYALSTSPLNRVVLDGLDHLWCRGTITDAPGIAGWTGPRDSQWIVPQDWRPDAPVDRLSMRSYEEFQSGHLQGRGGQPAGPWVIISDGRFATCLNHRLLARVLKGIEADVIALTASAELHAYQERVRLTPENELVGYRRLFADAVAPMPAPTDWPHHLLVRAEAFETLVAGSLLGEFGTIVERCRAADLRMRGIAVAGAAFDLESEAGVLALCRGVLDLPVDGDGALSQTEGRLATEREPQDLVSAEARLIGPVLLGKQVTVEPGAVIVGPTVLCDGCVVCRDSLVDSSIIGSGVSVEPGGVIRNSLALESGRGGGETAAAAESRNGCIDGPLDGGTQDAFRSWPKPSYAGSLKRVVDVVAAMAVLVLFAPVIPLIVLAIRISSRGPIFFRHKRQGLRGELFDCIKFRTMRPDADKIQDKLRFVCEVDGPQFKMADDPRITTVGRFLRETYLDEIPQFYNVLCGEMSVVGPRPSPESENTLCALWRDARLSVRPGITGLWQVRRTRVANKDFQEWIQYDTQYVRDLSPRLDLWICWRTFRRMVENFVNQF